MDEQRSAQLAAIVAASSDAIISIGTDLAVQTWNAGAQRLFGYREAEAIGRSIVELIVPRAHEAENAAIYAAAMNSKTAVLKETVRRHRDGRLLPVETNISPILDSAGNVAGSLTIIRDISERRRAGEERQKHAERQALLLRVTSDLIRATETSELSRITCRHIGPTLGGDICLNFRLDPERQHLILEFESGIPPELSEAAQSLAFDQAYCGMAAASRRPIVADKQRIACDPNGALVRTLGATAFAGYPLLASDGRLLGTFAIASRARESFTEDDVAWLGTVINFLAQAWERLEAEQGLRASEERLRLAQDAAGLGLWDFDLASGTLVLSRQVRKLIGVGPAEPASLPLLLSRLHAEDRQKLERLIARGYGPDSDRTHHFEFRVYMKNGALRWLEDWGRVETDATGRPIRVLGVVHDITARKNAEEMQARLAAIVTSSTDAIVGETLDGMVMSWNETAERMFRYPAVEMIGQSMRRLIPADRQPEEDVILARLARGERVEHYETVRIAKDGYTIDVSITASPMRDAEGRIIGVSKIVRDVTKRKRTEMQLAEREAQLALFIEHAPAAIAMFDTDMVCLAASRRFHSDYRVPEHVKVIGVSHYEAFPEIPPRWREVHRRVLAGEELSADEDPFLRPDGRTDWCRWSMKPWRMPDGRIGGALLFTEVITAQVEARRALAESEARFRATFENAAVGIAHVAPDGHWLRVNEALCRILGYPADELVVRSFQNITHPDDLAADLAEVKGMLDGKIDSYGIDKRYLRKGGSIVWVRVTVGRVRKSDGSIDYLVSVVEDISARKQAEQALSASKDRLQFALDAALLGWWQYDPLHRIVSGDPRSQRIFDFAEHEAAIEQVMMRVHPDDAARVRAAIDAALDPIDPKRSATEFRFRRRDGEVRWAETSGLAYFEGVGRERRAVNLVGTIADVTERKEYEEKEHLLMREINHRAKNMLNVVDSIARQTAARNPQDFVERFSQRIQALSASQDLLVRNEWKGVEIDDLVHSQLAHFADLIGSRIIVQGPRLRLNPPAVQAIGLALHELATNAGKYGALSTGAGHVDIFWESDGGTLTMSWTEHDGPVSPPKRRGFGTIVMEAAGRSVGGEVALHYGPSGVTWRLTCPAGNALERR
jgi:PAS domain S-box-containing protein